MTHLSPFAVRNAIAEWLIYNRNVSQFLRLENSRWRCWQIPCLMRVYFLFHRWISFHCVLTWQKEQVSSLGSFIRALLPFVRALLLWHNCPLNAPPPNTFTFVIRVWHVDFYLGGWGGDTNIQTIAELVCRVHEALW